MSDEKEMKEKLQELGFTTKEDLNEAIDLLPKDKQVDGRDYIEHMMSCEADDCAIHQAKDDLETKSFMLGLLAGKKLEQERS